MGTDAGRGLPMRRTAFSLTIFAIVCGCNTPIPDPTATAIEQCVKFCALSGSITSRFEAHAGWTNHVECECSDRRDGGTR